MPGSIPLNQSFFTSSASSFIASAIAALYTVTAILHAQNKTPLACSSLIPIGTAPKPGTLKSPWFGFQKGLRVEGFFVLGSSILNTSPEIVFSPQAIFHRIRYSSVPQYDDHTAIFFHRSGGRIGGEKYPRPRKGKNLIGLRNIKYNAMLALYLLKPFIRIIGAI